MFDRELAGSLEKSPLLPGIRYLACPLWTGLTVLENLSEELLHKRLMKGRFY